MLLHEKVRRLIRPYKKSFIAKAAGLSVQTLLNVLSGNKAPTLETARALAKPLGVEVGWLVDDEKGWPPVRTRPTTDSLPELVTPAA